MEETGYTRLHISPFNPALLKTIIPPSNLPNARNISYHSILTFPEKDYGYVELPVMDAEKIKKKLNGTILKGTKVRIEKARPQKKVVIEAEETDRPKKEKKKKRKRDELPGVDIGERQVKRGWTIPAKDVKKDQLVIKSKYTTGPECLFKTNLPPNVASKGKPTEVKPDKKKRKPGKEAVVHEFAKTTKYATFLRGSAGSNKTKTVAEFVEGIGWVDEDGSVIEEVKKLRKVKHTPVVQKDSSDSKEEPCENTKEPDQMDVDSKNDDGEESSSDSNSADENPDEGTSTSLEDDKHQGTAKDSSSESSSSDDETELVLARQAKPRQEQDIAEDTSDDSPDDSSDGDVDVSSPKFAAKNSTEDISSSDDSSDDESVVKTQVSKEGSSSSLDSSEEDSDSESSDSSDESEADSEVEEPLSAKTNRSQGSHGPALSIKIPDSLTSTPMASSVHPLEALYKRTKSDAMNPHRAAESSFSFFGADGDDEDIQAETQLQVPLTPFTQKDFEFRGIRSAAPTPDTAHANKRFVWPNENDEDEDDEATGSSPIRSNEAPKGKSKETAAEPESDFQKWFYENRGDVRRAWTGRRKSAAKEKRQRENRKREHRAI